MDYDALLACGLPVVSKAGADDAASTVASGGACESVPSGDESTASGGVVTDPADEFESSDAWEMWRSMCRPLHMSSSQREVSVVSFNMLLKGYESKPGYAKNPGVEPRIRAWSWRKPRFVELLQGVRADLYCLQEVEVNSFEEEFAFLPDMGYEAVAPQDGSRPRKRAAGAPSDLAKCAFFYRPSRLELIWTNHRSRTILALFKHVPTGKLLYAASCHLEGTPGLAAARVKQATSALEHIRLDQKNRDVPPEECCLVFAGDFNSEADASVCHLLRSGTLEASFRDPWAPDAELVDKDYSHDFILSDLYEPKRSGPIRRRPPTFHASTKTASRGAFSAIDFVFYSPRTLRRVAVREPFTPRQLEATSIAGLPAEWHFSDHVPVGGVFEFVDVEGDRPAHRRESGKRRGREPAVDLV